MADAGEVVGRLRAAYETGLTRPLTWRLAQLASMDQMLEQHSGRFEQALADDLGKAPSESIVTEIGFLRLELKHTRKHLRGWLRPKRSSVPFVVAPATAKTVLEPLGVALIIAPWNYPVNLALSPLIGALAAGNAVVVKPSELAPATSALLAEMLPKFLDARAVAVYEGGVSDTTELLEQRFDTIFYTGSTRVGRIVMTAAAKHLTPVTLELGGKSPVYVDATADLDVAANRIAWGKYINAGQTCVAPDYLLAHRDVAKQLVPKLEAAITQLYGTEPMRNPDYAHIVNEGQFDRLLPLLSDGTLAFGGTHDRDALRIAPTVLTGVLASDPVMQQEIFGPILPIVEVTDEHDAIRHVNAGEKPLALYVFTKSRTSKRRWLARTSSGAVCFDLPVAHLTVPGIPFGGVGESGMGSYHGRRSITAFSHEKAVFSKPGRPDTMGLIEPPYTPRRERLIRRLLG